MLSDKKNFQVDYLKVHDRVLIGLLLPELNRDIFAPACRLGNGFVASGTPVNLRGNLNLIILFRRNVVGLSIH